MIPRETRASDQPFPGAHSQVPGVRGEMGESMRRGSGAELRLEASTVNSDRGWAVRLPVRREHIVIDKQVVVYERVVLRRADLQDVTRVDSTVRREQTIVAVEGDAEVTPARA